MKTIILAILFLVIIGCGPENFSVSPDGKIASSEGYITDKEVSFHKEIPLESINWVKWSPDGKKLLCVTEKDHKNCFYLSEGDELPKKIFEGNSEAILPEWSPDMRYISFAAESEQEKMVTGSLFLYDTISKEKRTLLENVGMIHRWLPDSKRLVCKQVPKSENGYPSSENIVIVNIESGEIISLVTGLCYGLQSLDYDPATHSIIFPAVCVSLPAETSVVKGGKGLNFAIYAVNIDDKSLRVIKTGEPITFTTLSPDRKRILYVVIDNPVVTEDGIIRIDDMLKGNLYVMDMNGENRVNIGMSNDKFIPCWLSNNEIGFRGVVDKTDKEDVIWIYNMVDKKWTNFSDMVEQVKKENKK